MKRLISKMRTGLLIFFFMSLCGTLLAQQKPVGRVLRFPGFKAKADSARYYQLDSMIAYQYKFEITEKSEAIIDSLRLLWADALKASSGLKYFYQPSYTRWNDVAPADRSTVKAVSIYQLQARRLPEELLECSALETLEINSSSLKVIQKQLDRLPHLTRIEIYNPDQKHKIHLRKNKTVTQLIIRSNVKDALPRSYRKFSALMRLDLTRNHLTRFPRVFKNSKLRELRLSENELTLNDLQGKQYPQIEILDLRANRITAVPPAIGNFPSVISLSLNGNHISRVDEAIGKLQKLEYITLYSNELTTIPPALFSIGSLRNIDLYYNHITQVDNRILLWRDLVELHLAYNLITSLPPDIGQLKTLRGLYVHNNHLSKLPESLQELPSLEVLKVCSNYLTEVPDIVFKMPQLKTLDIADNQISSLPEALFNLKQFEILSIYGNPLNEATLIQLPDWIERVKGRGTVVLNGAK